MKWLRISNPGNFDVVKSISMLGASVKETDSPIGLFGSGVKFALAQAAREDIALKISTDEDIYSVCVGTDTFRDKEFSIVNLKSKTGKKIKTPMTTRFGAEDWTDSWFIFREFYSNALDEGNSKIEVVDGIEAISGHTCVFLPYSNFSEVYKNLEKYFTKQPVGLFVDGGEVFKKSVFVGKLEGTKVSLHNKDVSINECRVMNKDDAITIVANEMANCENSEVWEAFLSSEDCFLNNINVYVSKYVNERVIKAICSALVKVYGENYCLCPNVVDIIKDVESMGYCPVVLKGIDLRIESDELRTYKSLDNSQICRDMSETEQKEFDTIRKGISAFVPDCCRPIIKVISEGAAEILGQADMEKGIVYIRCTLFGLKDNHELINTIIHEFGHIITKRGDYDRTFTDFFVRALTNLVK